MFGSAVINFFHNGLLRESANVACNERAIAR